MTPAPVSSRITIFCSGPPSTKADAEGRVAGERQLVGGREDAYPYVGILGLRREHEDRLREVHLLARACIVERVEVTGVGEDRELVAGERLVGEDIGDDVAELAHPRL